MSEVIENVKGESQFVGPGKVVTGAEETAAENNDKVNDPEVGEITLEQFKNAITNNLECKGYFDSLCDKSVSKRLDKGIESWKEKNLQTIIENEINKRYPQKTEAELKIEEQQKALDESLENQKKLSQEIKYNSMAADKDIPKELYKFLYVDGYEDEKVTKNINIFDKFIGAMTEKFLKSYAPKPSGDDFGGVKSKSMWD